MIVPAASLLSQLAELAPGPVHLVGGSVRDLLLGITNSRDIDLVMPTGSAEVARRFADAAGGSFFFLDEERRITRVVTQGAGGSLQFDFADLEGPDLAADLARRDLTINAMALDLRAFLASRSLDGIIDPFGGRGDVRRRLIRVTAPRVLEDDPLRLLRVVRFAATLGFTIDPGTAEEVRKRSGLVLHPSPERIRDELFQVLSVRGAGRHLSLMDSLGLLTRLLPELAPLRDFAPGKHHRYDILTHSLRTAEYVDRVLDALPAIAPLHAEAVNAHLGERLEQFASRASALRFACLLHDSAKAATFSRDEDGDVHFFDHDTLGAETAAEICRRFRMANDTQTVVARLIRNHMRPLNLSGPSGPSKRALYRYCRDLKDAVPESIVLSLADATATSEVMPAGGFTDTTRTAAAILEYYYGKFLKTEAKPFVTGKDLIARGMRPGPKFREVLESIREKQAEGTLRDRDAALAYLDTIDSSSS